MRVGVVGGGLMGSGIAEVCARSGVDVTVVEADDAGVARAEAAIGRSLDRAIKAGKLEPAERQAAEDRLAYTTALADLEGADAAIEAVVEDEHLKREVFKQLDATLPGRPVPRLEHLVGADHEARRGDLHPGRVIGLHFFNPVPVLPLVEVVRSIMTTEEMLEKATSFAEETLGKTTIHSQDRAGFVVNALLIPYLLSAIRMYELGFASKEDIDEGMIKGCAHPIGPLSSDLIGLDTLLAVSESLYEEFRHPVRGARPAQPDGRGRPVAASPAAASTTTRPSPGSCPGPRRRAGGGRRRCCARSRSGQ